MKETVLLAGFGDPVRVREIQMVLMKQKIRARLIKPEEYLQMIGTLAGVPGMEKTEEVYEGNAIEEELIVLAGLSQGQLNQCLMQLRKLKKGTVSLKAILTDTNMQWNVLQLYEEIKTEHERMHAGGGME